MSILQTNKPRTDLLDRTLCIKISQYSQLAIFQTHWQLSKPNTGNAHSIHFQVNHDKLYIFVTL